MRRIADRFQDSSAVALSVDAPRARFSPGVCIAAVAVFAVLSLYCGIASQGFIAADACTHYMAAKYAWQNPINFVDAWNRPLITCLYAVPARLGGREAVRIVCMMVAIACGLVGLAIARGQGFKRPELALIFTLGQPLLFVHSFGEMTELPFALVLGLGFLAWQQERLWLAAVLVACTPLARPEGFGFVAIAAAALLLQRKWRQLLVLPIPVILWDLAGWVISHHSHPWWRWLPDSWPYSQTSLYGRGYLLTFVALLPAVVSPVVLPAVILGIWRSLTPSRSAQGEDQDEGPLQHHLEDPHPNPLPEYRARKPEPGMRPRESEHVPYFVFLTAALPLFVLVVHSLLYWLGKMASFGEARYMLAVAPFWGVLAARGWEWIWNRLQWRYPLRWASGAVLTPIIFNIVHPTVPVRLSHDWQSAREMARWYRSYSAGSPGKPFIATHPGIFYFLEANPLDSPGVGSLRHAPLGTILIWDPIFSEANASADCTLSLDAIHQAGWTELSAPDPYEAQMDAVRHPVRDPNDPRSHWHAFVYEK